MWCLSVRVINCFISFLIQYFWLNKLIINNGNDKAFEPRLESKDWYISRRL